jgi:hypothetical protein
LHVPQVKIEVYDVAAPEDLQLPSSAGALYIYVALAMGGVFFFSIVSVPILLGCLHVCMHAIFASFNASKSVAFPNVMISCSSGMIMFVSIACQVRYQLH